MLKTVAERKFGREDILLFRKIEKVVREIDVDKMFNQSNDCGEDIDVRLCHILSHTIVKTFGNGLMLRHGYFAKGYEHYWVETYNGNVIDMCPVGSINPVLMSLKDARRSGLYLKKENIAQKNLGDNFFKMIKALEHQIKKQLCES